MRKEDKGFLIFFILSILIYLFLFVYSYVAYGKENCPEKAKKYIPTLEELTEEYWPTICPIEILCGQIEAESNWNEKAERKAGREYGFGLVQITVVKGYFNEFQATKKRWSKEFKNWKWEDRFNPYYQLKYLVLRDKMLFNKCYFAETLWDRWAFTLSSYNGGFGGLLKDRKIARKYCNPNLWFNCVEKYTYRSRWAFIVNRRYVRKIMLKFAPKYRTCFLNREK